MPALYSATKRIGAVLQTICTNMPSLNKDTNTIVLSALSYLLLLFLQYFACSTLVSLHFLFDIDSRLFFVSPSLSSPSNILFIIVD